jgi:hypothetical protein
MFKRSRLHSMNRPRRDAPFALHWDRLRPDLLVVGLRFEPGGLTQYLGVTAHKLALHFIIVPRTAAEYSEL